MNNKAHLMDLQQIFNIRLINATGHFSRRNCATHFNSLEEKQLVADAIWDSAIKGFKTASYVVLEKLLNQGMAKNITPNTYGRYFNLYRNWLQNDENFQKANNLDPQSEKAIEILSNIRTSDTFATRLINMALPEKPKSPTARKYYAYWERISWPDGDTRARCSECGGMVSLKKADRYKFCPYCGLSMKYLGN
jgi:hypothetical protein